MTVHHPTGLTPDLAQCVQGVDFSHQAITMALAGCPEPFRRADFERALAAEVPHGLPVTTEIAKRILQALRRKGAIRYDNKAQVWRKGVPAALPEGALASGLMPIQTLPLAPSGAPSGNKATKPSTILAVGLRDGLSWLSCGAIVLALITINAGFAWELAENETFRVAFVAGLMACDLMRPLLVARGLFEIGAKRIARGCAAILSALSLAPLSVLSSTSVIGASLHLGVEANTQGEAEAQSLKALRADHQRLLARAARLWRDHEAECARGGCGPIAAGIRAKAEAADEAASQALSRVTALTVQGQERSAFIARTVKSFEDLRLFGPGQTMLIPLLLALTLEVAALFGPGLLLSRRREGRGTL